MKKIRCPECGGYGYVRTEHTENSVSARVCSTCKGKGQMWVPQTNADRIRAMDDETLAMQFAQYEYAVAKEVLARFGIDITKTEYNIEASAADMLEQLQQPAEGE